MVQTNGKLSMELEKAFADDAGVGFEGVTSSDLQIPFLRIIQALSPQLKRSDPAFLEGAQQGDIFNTVTNKFWTADEGVVVLPVYFETKMLEFVPRTQGGGFVGELSSGSREVSAAVRDPDTGMEILESGNELVRSASHYIKIVHENGNYENAIVDMKKTQLKKSRQWLSMMMMKKQNGSTLPSFAHMYRLRSVEDGNDKGSWFTWSISLVGVVESLVAYTEAKELHGSIKRGEMRLGPPPTDAALEAPVEKDLPF
ncbi:MAG: hypothetical protein DK304_001413 [Chloroflexi bacterium]|jgi:hypothetical protein|nr:MAG: hypothetical protein DK304_001413 [Chloroflexota bacterium]